MSSSKLSFISEKQIEEKKRKRIEDWEEAKRQNPDLVGNRPPEEAPYDPRPLYERLQEQKNAKQAEFEEKFKFKNMIAHVEGDDIEFLELVDEEAKKKELERAEELQREIETFRNHVTKVDAPITVTMAKPATAQPAVAPKKDTQRAALSYIVKKRKQSGEEKPQEEAGNLAHKETTDPAAVAAPAPGKPAPAPTSHKPTLLGLDYASSDDEE